MVPFDHIDSSTKQVNQSTKENSMSKLTDLIEQSNGKFISVTFIKKDGSERVLVGRLGVTSRLKGGTSTLDHRLPIERKAEA